MTSGTRADSIAAIMDESKDPYAVEVGQRLKLLRLAYDENVTGFAASLGQSRKNYAHIEAGLQFPRPHLVRLLAAKRGVDWNWVWAGDESNLRPDTKRKLDEYRQQSRRKKNTVDN